MIEDCGETESPPRPLIIALPEHYSNLRTIDPLARRISRHARGREGRGWEVCAPLFVELRSGDSLNRCDRSTERHRGETRTRVMEIVIFTFFLKSRVVIWSSYLAGAFIREVNVGSQLRGTNIRNARKVIASPPLLPKHDIDKVNSETEPGSIMSVSPLFRPPGL